MGKSGHTGTVDPGTGCERVEALTSTFSRTVFRRSASASSPSRTTSACSGVHSSFEVGRAPVLPMRRSCQAVKARPAFSSRFGLRVSTSLQEWAMLRRETLRVSARGSNGSPVRHSPTLSSSRMARRTPATRPMTVSMRAFSVGSTARLSDATRPSNATQPLLESSCSDLGYLSYADRPYRSSPLGGADPPCSARSAHPHLPQVSTSRTSKLGRTVGGLSVGLSTKPR